MSVIKPEGGATPKRAKAKRYAEVYLFPAYTERAFLLPGRLFKHPLRVRVLLSCAKSTDLHTQLG
jgi:hypothetical protein